MRGTFVWATVLRVTAFQHNLLYAPRHSSCYSGHAWACSKKINQKQCVLLMWDKVSLSTTCMSEKIKWRRCVHHVSHKYTSGRNGFGPQRADLQGEWNSHMYLGCVWRSLWGWTVCELPFLSGCLWLQWKQRHKLCESVCHGRLSVRCSHAHRKHLKSGNFGIAIIVGKSWKLHSVLKYFYLSVCDSLVGKCYHPCDKVMWSIFIFIFIFSEQGFPNICQPNTLDVKYLLEV